MSEVCLVNTNKAWGGGEKWHYEAAVYLKSKGYKVKVIVAPESPLYSRLKKVKIETIPLCVGKISFLNFFKVLKVTKILQKNKFSALILNLPQDAKFFGLAGHFASINKIIYRRGMDHPIKPSLINKIIYKNFVTDFIANSREVKKSIYKYIPELKKKVHIIYNSVSLLESPPSKKLGKKIILGNLGRLVEQKGQIYLLQLAKELKKLSIDFEVKIAGSGPLEEELQAKIKEFGLENHVYLVGLVKPEDFLKTIDLFIFPSLFEGLSNALLEALLYQKPIIAFNTSSNYEIITHGYNGILVPKADITKLTKAVILLSKDSARFRMFQQNGLLMLKSKFNHQYTRFKLEEILK